MNQILAGGGNVTLTKSWYTDGTLNAGIDTVTIGIVDGNGTTVVAAGTATTDVGDGTYTYTLADQNNPNQLTVTWTDVSTGDTRIDRIEVIGNWLFTEVQARTFGSKADATSGLIPFASSTEYTDAMLADERARIGDDLEYWTGRSWIPRYARVAYPGSNSTYLPAGSGVCRTSDGYQLNRPGRTNDIAVVLSASVGGTAQTVGDIEVDPARNMFVHTNGSWSTGTDPFNVVIEYVYGLPYIVDGIDRIALKLLVDRLVPSGVPDRATRWDMPDGSSMNIIQPGGPFNNVSRLPEVNQWVQAHNHKILVG
jgi:hypothetical protein